MSVLGSWKIFCCPFSDFDNLQPIIITWNCVSEFWLHRLSSSLNFIAKICFILYSFANRKGPQFILKNYGADTAIKATNILEHLLVNLHKSLLCLALPIILYSVILPERFFVEILEAILQMLYVASKRSFN